jgi:toxin ParE1/3/4
VSNFSVTPEARADLAAIDDDIRTYRPAAARRMLEALNSRFAFLALLPESGTRRPRLGRDVRFFVERRYVIYYRPVPAGVQILRVLHGSRRVTADDFPHA